MMDCLDFSCRRLCAKTMVAITLGFGIACAIFAAQSSFWYEFNHETRNIESWNFLPSNKTEVTSIGLFQYQMSSSTSRYDPSFVGKAYPWMFAAQICAILGPIFGFFGLILLLWKTSDYYTTILCIIVATSLQSASAIAGMSLCDQFMTCPWLIGSIANLSSISSFGLALILSNFGLLETRQLEVPNEEDSGSIETRGPPSVRSTQGLQYEASYGLSMEDDDDVNADQETEKASNTRKSDASFGSGVDLEVACVGLPSIGLTDAIGNKD